MRLALYQPEIPQNTGTLLRLGACLGFSLDIIEPCGFIMNDRKMKRSGMDYLEKVQMTRHNSWESFKETTTNRLILLSPIGEYSHLDFQFRPDDILLLGKESSGVPEHVRAACTHSVFIPMREGCRSLNVAIAAALVVGEALRQTNQFGKE
jgi:tRNA (cytidine/uridine-2'-O-)-methyltransferase